MEKQIYCRYITWLYMSYFEILSFILRRFQQLFEQSYLFICDIGTIWLDWRPKSEMKKKKRFARSKTLWISSWLLMQHSSMRPGSCCCWPVGRIIFRSAGNVLWIICEFILLDFRLQIFGFGSARTWTWPMPTFAIQLLLLGFVARRCGRVRVFSQLQKALVSLLVLPVCEDLRENAEAFFVLGKMCSHLNSTWSNWLGTKAWYHTGESKVPCCPLPASAPPGLGDGGWLRTGASPAPAAGCPAPRCQCHRLLSGRAQPCSGDTTSRVRRA